MLFYQIKVNLSVLGQLQLTELFLFAKCQNNATKVFFNLIFTAIGRTRL